MKLSQTKLRPEGKWYKWPGEREKEKGNRLLAAGGGDFLKQGLQAIGKEQ